MPDPDEIWVVIDSTGAVSAYDTRDAAINATRDTDDDVWIERATIQGTQQPSEGPRSAEQAQEARVPERRQKSRETGAQPITVPTSLGRDATYWDPWSGPDSAA